MADQRPHRNSGSMLHAGYDDVTKALRDTLVALLLVASISSAIFLFIILVLGG